MPHPINSSEAQSAATDPQVPGSRFQNITRSTPYREKANATTVTGPVPEMRERRAFRDTRTSGRRPESRNRPGSHLKILNGVDAGGYNEFAVSWRLFQSDNHSVHNLSPISAPRIITEVLSEPIFEGFMPCAATDCPHWQAVRRRSPGSFHRPSGRAPATASRTVPLLIAVLLAAGAQAQQSASAPYRALPEVAPGAGPVQAIALGASPGPGKAVTASSSAVNITADGWQGTGVQLAAGDRVVFDAKGSMVLSDARAVSPAGSPRGWRDLLRMYPLSSAGAGALIGRIGKNDAALPFAIGASDTLTAPVGGELYLRANLSPDLTAQGTYRVKVHVEPGKHGVSGPSSAMSQDLARKLSPALFANIPRRVQDQQGNPGDMVNFALIGSEQQVKTDLANAGWIPTDANTQDALIHGLLQTLEHQSYHAVPMSTLYLFGRPQDMAYARGHDLEVAASRNHLRLWKSAEIVDGKPLWVGSATHDHGFETDQRNGGITHHIDPDIDQERDFIVQSLADSGGARAAAYVLPANPVASAKTATGGSFTTDGRIAVILLQ